MVARSTGLENVNKEHFDDEELRDVTKSVKPRDCSGSVEGTPHLDDEPAKDDDSEVAGLTAPDPAGVLFAAREHEQNYASLERELSASATDNLLDRATSVLSCTGASRKDSVPGYRTMAANQSPPASPLLQAKSEDSVSVAANSIFQLDDFSSDTWTSVMLSYGVPTIGFIAFGLFHPVLFLTATSMAAVSFGAYHACGDDIVTTHCPSAAAAEATVADNLQDHEKEVSTNVTEPTLVMMSPDEEQGNHDCVEVVGDEDGPKIIPSSPLTVPETKAKTDPPVMEIEINNSLNGKRTLSAVGEGDHLGSPGSRQTSKPEPVEVTPPPPLSKMILNKEEFHGCGLSAEEFFLLFWGDDAAFSFEEFQRQRGDIHIHYGGWTTSNEGQKQTRTLQFETPTKGLIGAAYAKARKEQYILVRTPNMVVLESATFLSEIPFCDRFCIREQWALEHKEGEKTVALTVTAQADFSAPCGGFIESQIQSKSVTTMRAVCKHWKSMAHAALQITRQKRKREQEASATDHTTDNGIEVEYEEHQPKSGGDIDVDEDDKRARRRRRIRRPLPQNLRMIFRRKASSVVVEQ